MTYDSYKKALGNISKKYDHEIDALLDEINELDAMLEKKQIDKKEHFEETKRLSYILDGARGRCKRSIERLKLNYAKQDAPAKIGDIIWGVCKGTTKVMRVEEIRLASFEYPMLKYFGKQLTLYGLPCKCQLQSPRGGIYQKDITSVNGVPYIYKER